MSRTMMAALVSLALCLSLAPLSAAGLDSQGEANTMLLGLVQFFACELGSPNYTGYYARAMELFATPDIAASASREWPEPAHPRRDESEWKKETDADSAETSNKLIRVWKQAAAAGMDFESSSKDR